MTKQQLIICVGLPASGKSTWAKQWVREDAKNRVRVNKDDIRRMLTTLWSGKLEKIVKKIEFESVRNALDKGFSVVLDNTNFRINQDIINVAKHYNVEIITQDFTHVSIEECIERDKNRFEKVGEYFIKRMAEKYLK